MKQVLADTEASHLFMLRTMHGYLNILKLMHATNVDAPRA